jgi:SAM-dependent methyltransferase
MAEDGGAADRELLRQTFDEAAERYHRARPGYPPRLFDDLVSVVGLRPGAQLLEVGCGTGGATEQLARRGFQITCLELGPRLAAAAARNLAAYPAVRVVNEAYESWQPPGPAAFDLVYAATAWHWLDPATRYQRAHDWLRPDGHLAFWSATHAFPDGGDPFFQEIQAVYEEIGEGPADPAWPRPGELPDDRADIEASGLFCDVQIRHYDWEVRYGAESYIDLLLTFSGHIAMAGWQRERLFTAIRQRLATRPDRQLRRHWGAVLHIARRHRPTASANRHSSAADTACPSSTTPSSSGSTGPPATGPLSPPAAPDCGSD